jgi:hypothetical protein
MRRPRNRRHTLLSLSRSLTIVRSVCSGVCRAAAQESPQDLRVHVAFVSCPRRHSPFSLSPASLCEATCIMDHARVARGGSSRCFMKQSDVLNLACRLARPTQATSMTMIVALLHHAKRHASSTMSLGIVKKGDMLDQACRLSRRTKATFLVMGVALYDLPGRHSLRRMSPRSDAKGDILAQACRFVPVCKATCEA